MEILDLAFEGKGIAKVKTEAAEKYFTVFVDGALPGDKVTAQIIKKKSNYAEARVVEIIKP